MVCVRLTWGGVDLIDEFAAQEGVDRSEMIRRLLGEAVAARQQRTVKLMKGRP